MAMSPKMADWIAIFPGQMEHEVRDFINMVIDCGRQMGFSVSEPRMQVLLIVISNFNI